MIESDVRVQHTGLQYKNEFNIWFLTWINSEEHIYKSGVSLDDTFITALISGDKINSIISYYINLKQTLLHIWRISLAMV